MSAPLPKYDSPPVNETLLGVQFDPLPKLLVAHLGTFLARLGGDWQPVPEVPAIGQLPPPELDDWAGPALRLQVSGAPGLRLRAIDRVQDRLLQLENGWFVLNWHELRAGARYPDYERRKEQFTELWQAWCEFLQTHALGEMRPRLWEVSYVNFIDRSSGLWSSVADWHAVLPALLGPMSLPSAGPLQTLEGRWRYALGSDAHLTIDLQHRARTASGEDETLLERLVARGFAATPDLEALFRGFDRGHEAIVRTFGEAASEAARKHWKQRP